MTTAGVPPTENPVLDSGWDGTNKQTLLTDTGGRLIQGAYALSVPINLSSSGLQQIIAAGSGITTVAYIELAFASAVNIKFEAGTGSNCGSSTVDLTGVLQNVVTYTRDTPFIVPSGKALCIDLSASVVGGGSATYAQP